MSNKEKCVAILDRFTEDQLVHVATMLQAMRKTIEDLEEEAFCEQMVRDYEDDPEKGDPMPIEDFARELGIQL